MRKVHRVIKSPIEGTTLNSFTEKHLWKGLIEHIHAGVGGGGFNMKHYRTAHISIKEGLVY